MSISVMVKSRNDFGVKLNQAMLEFSKKIEGTQNNVNDNNDNDVMVIM